MIAASRSDSRARLTAPRASWRETGSPWANRWATTSPSSDLSHVCLPANHLTCRDRLIGICASYDASCAGDGAWTIPFRLLWEGLKAVPPYDADDDIDEPLPWVLRSFE
jgi:hypothetical protein